MKYIMLVLLLSASFAPLQAMNKQVFSKEEQDLLEGQVPIADELNKLNFENVICHPDYECKEICFQRKRFHQATHNDSGHIFLLPIESSAPDYFKYQYKNANKWQPKLLVECQLEDKKLLAELEGKPWKEKLLRLAISYTFNPDKIHYESWFRIAKAATGFALICSGTIGLTKYFSGEPTMLGNPAISLPVLFSGAYLSSSAINPDMKRKEKLFAAAVVAPIGTGIIYLANKYR